MKIAVSAFGILLLFLILFSLWGVYSAIRPNKLHSVLTPADFLIPYENVTFLTEDNIIIHGWFIPNADPKAKTIILLHGYPADKGNILPAMIFLHDDYNLLFFDFRYLGESAGSYSTVGINEVLDLKAAIAYLHTRGIDEVGVWGFSLGGAVALMAAPTTPEIKALVAQSPYAELDWMANDYYSIPLLKYPLTALTRLWGLVFLQVDIKSISPARALQGLTIPVLLINSVNDEVVSPEHGILLQESSRNNPHTSFIFIEKQHGYFMDNNDKVILDFFRTALP